MAAGEIAKLNTAYEHLMEKQTAVEPPQARLDEAAATSLVADEAKLHYVRWEKAGSYYKNARGELVFGQSVGGFIAPPTLVFEAEDE